MGNFCMGDKGRNGIADRKHEKPPKGPHFRPKPKTQKLKLESIDNNYKNLNPIFLKKKTFFVK